MESICDKIIEFQRTGHYDVIYVKMKELKLGKKVMGLNTLPLKTIKERS
jgi:hypothetical protein